MVLLPVTEAGPWIDSAVRTDPTRQRDEPADREDDPRADDHRGGERDDRTTAWGVCEEADSVGNDEDPRRR